MLNHPISKPCKSLEQIRLQRTGPASNGFIQEGQLQLAEPVIHSSEPTAGRNVGGGRDMEAELPRLTEKYGAHSGDGFGLLEKNYYSFFAISIIGSHLCKSLNIPIYFIHPSTYILKCSLHDLMMDSGKKR